MRIACSSRTFSGDFEGRRIDLLSFLDLAAELGLDGIECTPDVFLSISPRFLCELRPRLARGSVKISAVTLANDFDLPDAAERKNQCEDLTRWTAACRDLGVGVLCVRTGSLQEGIEPSRAAGWVRSCLEAVLPAAERAAVTLAVRNAPGVLSTPEELVEMVMRFGSSHLQLACDPAAVPAGGSRASLRQLARISVNSYLGLGDTDVDEADFTCDPLPVLETYRSGCYRGCLTLEYSGRKDPAKVVRNAVGRLRSIDSKLETPNLKIKERSDSSIFSPDF